jgi:hypothetical protein
LFDGSGNSDVAGLKRFGERVPTLFCLKTAYYLHRHPKKA